MSFRTLTATQCVRTVRGTTSTKGSTTEMMRGGMGGGARFRTRAAIGMGIGLLVAGSTVGAVAAGAAPAAKPPTPINVVVPNVTGHVVTATFTVPGKLSAI